MPKITEKDGIRGLVPDRSKASLDRTYSEYLKQIDPRYNVDAQCALAESKDPRFKEFLERISDYQYRNHTYVAIAKACSIDLSDFSSWWRKTCTQRALAIAQTKTPEIVKDMANDAKSRVVACEKCDGLGWVAAPDYLPLNTPGYRKLVDGPDPKWIRDCPMGCNDGKTTKPGDSHSRDILLEMSGLVSKGKAAVQITQNFGGASHASAVTQLDVITIDGDVIDASPVSQVDQ